MDPTVSGGTTGDGTVTFSRPTVSAVGRSGFGARWERIAKATAEQQRRAKPPSSHGKSLERLVLFGSVFSGSIVCTDHPDPE